MSDVLTRAEARRLIDGCNGRDETRNRALLTLLYRAGLRSNEAAELWASDVRLVDGGGEVFVRKPKGWANGVPQRVVGFDATAWEIVDAWLAERTPVAPRWLFYTRTGKQIQTSYMRQLVPRVASTVGIHRRCHPHILRHTFARQLYDEKKGMRTIQLLLGHTSLATTETYLKSIGAIQAVSEGKKREAW